MIRKFFLSLFVMCIHAQYCFGSETFCDKELLSVHKTSHEKKETLKQYVSPAQIEILPSGICILFDHARLYVDSIFHDKGGYYFVAEGGVLWICNICGSLNDLDDNICSSCGNPYGS